MPRDSNAIVRLGREKWGKKPYFKVNIDSAIGRPPPPAQATYLWLLTVLEELEQGSGLNLPLFGGGRMEELQKCI